VQFSLLFSYLLTSSALLSHQPKVEDSYAYPTSQICYIFTTSSHYLFFFYPPNINNTPHSSLISPHCHSLHHCNLTTYIILYQLWTIFTNHFFKTHTAKTYPAASTLYTCL
ncbi:hypothetical protein VIGAN_06269200, partial [Vigna angularis var. angularis]